MLGADTATHGVDSEHDDVLWLQPRGDARPLKPHRTGRVRSCAARVTASLGFGALLAATSVGTALAPSTPAHASADALRLRVQAAPAPEEAQGPDAAALLREAPSMVLAREVNAPRERDASAREAARLEDAQGLILAALEPVASAEEVPLAIAPLAAEAGRAGDPNEILQFGAMKVSRHLVETILRAAEVTGVDPVYMMALADKESSFSPQARARTSSAEGLFQFLNQTWLEMIRDHGAAHGYAAEAAAVVSLGGELTIADERTRERVLNLRRDPYVAALMAGELLKRDRKRIERRIGRNLTRNELYLSHFFGAGAAGKFISLRDDKPKQKAAGVFPQAARANQALFFAREGRRKRGLTVAEVHERIDQMIEHRANRYAGVHALLAFASAP